MASNFRISTRRKQQTMELKLTGDFDGTSADELLHLLGKDTRGINRVLVDTRYVRRVYDFGADTFQKNLYRLKRLSLQLVFTGDKADLIAPENSRFCQWSGPE